MTEMKEHFQTKLDALLDEMEMYGFYAGMPDEPSDRVVVLSYDDDDEEGEDDEGWSEE